MSPVAGVKRSGQFDFIRPSAWNGRPSKVNMVNCFGALGLQLGFKMRSPEFCFFKFILLISLNIKITYWMYYDLCRFSLAPNPFFGFIDPAVERCSTFLAAASAI